MTVETRAKNNGFATAAICPDCSYPLWEREWGPIGRCCRCGKRYMQVVSKPDIQGKATHTGEGE